MKKFFLIILFCLPSFILLAQNRVSYSLEMMAGVGVTNGPKYTIAPEFIVQYDLGNGINMGVGGGAQLSKPCYRFIDRDGIGSRSYCNEIDIPLFFRFGYGKDRLFADLDLGYSIGLMAGYEKDVFPGGEMDTCHYSGFFAEPHIGFCISRRSSLSLGILLQQSSINTEHITTTSVSLHNIMKVENVLTPAFTLRYGFTF